MSGIESFSHSLLIYLPLSIILAMAFGYMGFKLAAIQGLVMVFPDILIIL